MKSNINPQPSLILCLILDVVGCLSFFMPVYNVLFKLLWAPVAALIYFRMFGGRLGFFGGVALFIEETSSIGFMIPTFTITFLAKSKIFSSQPSRAHY